MDLHEVSLLITSIFLFQSQALSRASLCMSSSILSSWVWTLICLKFIIYFIQSWQVFQYTYNLTQLQLLSYPIYCYNFVRMIPKPAYKLKSKTQINKEKPNASRYTTEYQSKSKPSSIRNKLTKGCKKYEQLKDAYSNCKPGQNHLKTDYNQYTFQPRLSSKRKNSRSFNKFLEDQENFQMNKQNKIRQFKTEATKVQITQCTARPEIDVISNRICTLMNYTKDQVVDRLFKQKALQQYTDDEDLFSPKILPKSHSLKRSQNITELLHSDALRRKQKLEVREAEKQMPLSPVPNILNNTYQLVSKKLYHEFCQLAPEDEPILPIVLAWAVISQIFGIQLNPNKKGREGKICSEMTRFLCQQGEETVHREKLWDFIEIIIKKGNAKSKFFNEELEQIIQNFGNLYTCRVAKPKSQRSPQKMSFFPETLRSSGQKAQKFRQKILHNAKEFMENENLKLNLKQQMAIEDIFTIQYVIRQASIQKKKLEKEKQIMKQCTFKPRLSQAYKRPSYLPPRPEYSRSKYTQGSKKTLFQSVSDQNLSFTQSFMCTSFKPSQLKSNINESHVVKCQKDRKPLKQKQRLNVSCSIKNMEKSIMRMAIARKDRQLSNELKNRGYPKNIENWTQYANKQKKQITKEHRKLKGLTYKKVTLR